MRIDLEAVPQESQFETVCIVGAGIAWLLLARDLSKEGSN